MCEGRHGCRAHLEHAVARERDDRLPVVGKSEGGAGASAVRHRPRHNLRPRTGRHVEQAHAAVAASRPQQAPVATEVQADHRRVLRAHAGRVRAGRGVERQRGCLRGATMGAGAIVSSETRRRNVDT